MKKNTPRRVAARRWRISVFPLALAVLAASAACKNHWMESIVDFMYEDEQSGITLTDNGPGSGPDNLLTITLFGTVTNWSGIVDAINASGGAGKYIALDLSACTIAGTPGEFDPDSSNSVGKDKVVFLFLPDTATGIAAGTSGFPTFKGFTILTHIGGSGIVSVGDYAFSSCAALSSVSLPAAASIGDYAFSWCTALSSVSFPAAENIGIGAFSDCTALSSVSLPVAASIGDYAFINCTALSSVSFPAAASIGFSAFSDCTALSSVSLPAAENIGGAAFDGCTGLTSLTFGKAAAPWPVLGAYPFLSTGAGTLTIHVPSGTLSDYTGAWGVSAFTPANGNISVYGPDHKAINITDVP
jgi:hypothetical protein